jgi:16S rRNA (adenine1518-N6/adenine1519-N6)-dimethyltransferase
MEYIATPNKTKDMLKKHDLTLKKSLGQNFLVDPNILRNIVAAAELTPEKGALEIGPGIGALTQHLAESAGRVVAVEIDRRLLPILQETMSDYPHATIINQDILSVDLHALFLEYFPEQSSVSVVANLPYYVTTPIVMKLLEARLPLENIVVMVQKEVAQRMGGAPGSKAYGSLSVAVQYYCETDIVAIVPRTVFIPQPDVESAVIRLRVLPKPSVQVTDEHFFFEVVHAAFAQRRKTLINNLLAKFGKGNKNEIIVALGEAGIEPMRRGETLSLQEFAALTDALIQHSIRE